MVLQSRCVRYCSNFSPSGRKEILKTRYFTLEEDIQRFFDDGEQNEIDFVTVSPENVKAGDEEVRNANILTNENNVLLSNTAGPLFKNAVEKSFCLPMSSY
ncbi:hypothetical protein AVEN_83286-1 [Araneus ventricosus]|uniref:Uncharacterized protein n=1 Tax=Araneus ventricosus TaxID=182803 RepID=A0A4Y2T734_ARAVE|nr:hypothetical protein AVEN_83286-1 [Araneus ventricosus]